MENSRQAARENWSQAQIQRLFPEDYEKYRAQLRFTPVSGDASFRQYFRATLTPEKHWIIMDAPPEKENCEPFIAIAQHWHRYDIAVPEILAQDLEQGFLLLTDFGDQLYLDHLQNGRADELYGKAISTLLHIQQAPENDEYTLPAYDVALLQREMALFPDWLLTQELDYTLSDAEQTLLKETFHILVVNAQEQPQLAVHRDYHSRNLMIPRNPETIPGVLDFQDAVKGPITYDLVSLLRDCYIRWPQAKVEQWLQDYWQQSQAAGLHQVGLPRFRRWFDLMGVQRHLKAAGIFARLHLRDGKKGYLKDIPLTVSYITQVCQHYPELKGFGDWLGQQIVPRLQSLACQEEVVS
ncbi:MAG: phosphotransferase [Pseudomonadales bacterium]|nr:phosphotransferase [Pseudomonadales bacterium]